MAKVLRVVVVLLLLLGIASLVLGWMLFEERETIKSRIQTLERAHMDMARRLTDPRDPHIEAIPERLDGDALKDVERMADQLSLLDGIARNRLDELFDTRGTLQTTREELAETRNVLAETRRELSAARDQIASLERNVTRLEGDLAQARQTIRDREETIAARDAQIEEMDGRIAELTEEADDLRQRIAVLERWRPADAADLTRPVPIGLSGSVILVKPEWDFVILDIGSDAGLQPNAELLVHREEALVGRIRVVSVRDHIAVADVQRDARVEPLQEGDTVFYGG